MPVAVPRDSAVLKNTPSPGPLPHTTILAASAHTTRHRGKDWAHCMQPCTGPPRRWVEQLLPAPSSSGTSHEHHNRQFIIQTRLYTHVRDYQRVATASILSPLPRASATHQQPQPRHCLRLLLGGGRGRPHRSGPLPRKLGEEDPTLASCPLCLVASPSPSPCPSRLQTACSLLRFELCRFLKRLWTQLCSFVHVPYGIFSL